MCKLAQSELLTCAWLFLAHSVEFNFRTELVGKETNMSKGKVLGLNNVLPAAIVALLFAVFSVASCGGGGNTPASPLTSDPTPNANSNLLGINIAPTVDFSGDRLYADVVRTARDFESGGTVVPVDADGWPMADFGFYVWAGIDKMHGTYTLTFTGHANSVSRNPPNTNIPLTYDSVANTTTGTFVYSDASSNSLYLNFTGTRRTSGDALGSGVTSIKLMRPLTPGSTKSYPPTTLFNDPIKALISKFSVVRYMDYLNINSNVQTNWSDRARPTWASFQRNPGGAYGWAGIGGPWEHIILLSNETGKDAWINIPVRATDDYIKKVAQVFAFGSDGTNPYTSPQNNPVYPPLNPTLKVYVEYSNELWNFAPAFKQASDNCQAASDELVNTSGSSPLNWDGSWNSLPFSDSGWNWSMCGRRAAKRTVEISNILRSVVGDAAMITHVRPVLMTQLTNAQARLLDETKMMLDYYNNLGGNFVAIPHPPNYYLYGAGGSGYYWPATTDATADAIFSDTGMTPAGFAPGLQGDIKLVAAMGLKRVAYEGGPSLDKTGGVRDAASALAVADPRMTTTLVNMHNAWSNNGGELFVYFSGTGDYQWGFTSDIYNLSTPKLLAIDALKAAAPAPLTFGTIIPGSVAGTAADACSRAWSCGANNFSATGTLPWASYTFRSTASAPCTVNLSFTSANAKVAIYVDGTLVDTQKNTTGGALSFNAGTIGVGIHGVIVRAVSGTFSLDTVAIVQNNI
jgi:hypothetical protein